MYDEINALLEGDEEQNFELVLQLVKGIGFPPNDYDFSCRLTDDGDKIKACVQNGLATKIIAMRWDARRLSKLPPYCKQFINLKYLSLNNNKFTTISTDIQALSLLEELYLQANQIKSFPSALASLTQLKQLNLAENGLMNWGEQPIEWNNLEGLDVSRNNLSQLPEMATSWTKLSVLKANRNFIKFLPHNFAAAWQQIHSLYLSWNLLQPSEIEQIAAMPSLQVLTLCSNNIQKLPQDLSAWQTLEKLDLSFNLLTELPAAITQLPKLKVLKLKGNPLAKESRYKSALERLKQSLPLVEIEC